jgi:hypothetical protein
MAGPIKVQTGGAKIEISQAEILALADRLTSGALSTFTRAAHRQMDPVVQDARTDRALWPIRSGKSIGATFVADRLGPSSVSVTAFSKLPYVYKMRYSRLTTEAIDGDSREFAAKVSRALRPYLDRVNPTDRTLRKQWKGRSFKGLGGAQARVAHHFMERASNGTWSGWRTDAKPTEDAIRRSRKGGLIRAHGTGAPSEAVAGKHVWSVRVRRPAKKREGALIEEARDALDTLAGG